ncbi:hypothetical protein WN51_04955 [Melipona quadrifasciata]|uniref:Uncharacterized protein n=1 Tax=Melipona quadrifasciata TaxID=166423 RepID=A0A0M8ZU55_9HYME|nr:hypothetical protein WN51_04955 [Melipona quadrifasciata]
MPKQNLSGDEFSQNGQLNLFVTLGSSTTNLDLGSRMLVSQPEIAEEGAKGEGEGVRLAVASCGSQRQEKEEQRFLNFTGSDVVGPKSLHLRYDQYLEKKYVFAKKSSSSKRGTLCDTTFRTLDVRSVNRHGDRVVASSRKSKPNREYTGFKYEWPRYWPKQQDQIISFAVRFLSLWPTLMKVYVHVPKTAEDMRQQIVQECRNTTAPMLSNAKHSLRIRLQKRLDVTSMVCYSFHITANYVGPRAVFAREIVIADGHNLKVTVER